MSPSQSQRDINTVPADASPGADTVLMTTKQPCEGQQTTPDQHLVDIHKESDIHESAWFDLTFHPDVAFDGNTPPDDGIILISGDDIAFYTSKKPLVRYSTFFADLMGSSDLIVSRDNTPITLSIAEGDGLALVLHLLLEPTRVFQPKAQGIYNALLLADFLTMPYIIDRLRQEAAIARASLSISTFTRFLYAVVLDEEELVRKRAWETLPMGIQLLPKDTEAALQQHQPLFLHRLRDLHQRHGQVWLSLRQSFMKHSPQIAELARWRPACMPVPSTAPQDSPTDGCTEYKSYNGDYRSLRVYAAGFFIMVVFQEVHEWAYNPAKRKLILILRQWIHCENCRRNLATLFHGCLKMHETRLRARFPVPPSWLHPDFEHYMKRNSAA